MKILMITNYYYPYISGLSEVVRQISEEFCRQGHEVKVLCSNHNHLPERENVGGVEVIRAPILAKISKGTISFKFIAWAKMLSQNADIVNLHLPMLESGLIISKIGGKKCVCSYQCDIDLKKGILNNFIKFTMLKMNDWALKQCSKILVTTLDYGTHSILAGKYPEKLVEVRTPIKNYNHVITPQRNKKVIGFCGRIVMEKGIDVLLKAYSILKKEMLDIELLIGGDYKNVAGGSIYQELKDYVEANQLEDVYFLGAIPEEQMEEFYSGLDVFVLPSTNPLEAFGMVQIEAMYCGTPVVASDLYGVRTIVQNTGMGLVAKKGDSADFAAKIKEVLSNKERYVKDKVFITNLYSTERCAKDYINVYRRP